MASVLRSTLKWLAGTPPCSGAATIAQRADTRRGLLRVLTYHRVINEDPLAWPGVISATPAEFQQHMQLLASAYRVVCLEQVLDAVLFGRPLPPRAVLVTFDDAYADFAAHAWPVLRQLRLPAVLFVPTGFPNHPERCFWWDRLHRACLLTKKTILLCRIGKYPLGSRRDRLRASWQLNRQVKSLAHDAAMDLVAAVCDELEVPAPQSAVLTWNELRRLRGEGLDLAPHTVTHPLLHRVSASRALAEAVESRRRLKEELGTAPPVFAYPGGHSNEEVVEALRRAGFELAFTTRPGVNRLAQADPLKLRRINISRGTTGAYLRLRILASG